MTTIKTKVSYFIEAPKIIDEGSLVFTEGKKHLPFNIKRVYFISNVKKGAVRGHHAHKKCQQVLFCIQGKVKIHLDNGFEKEDLLLDKPNIGVFLDKMIWHQMSEFEKDTTLLIFASEYYKASDYIRDYEVFKKHVGRLESFISTPDVVHEGSVL